MKASARLVSRTHRALGIAATVPIVGWILSSFVLHGVGLALPNGLQGVYELERVYDARIAARLDPLPDDMLRAVANAQLTGTVAEEIHPGDEFNRYYTRDRVPAVAVEMAGEQPSELVFSRASGRVLRRTDPMAAWFDKAYKSVHVWQWGDSLRLFTAVLYGLAGVGLLLVGMGYTLWWTRRAARRRWTDDVRPARRVHARLAPVAGFLLVTQMLVGAFLWYNLGLIEPRASGGRGRSRTSGAAASRSPSSLPPLPLSPRPSRSRRCRRSARCSDTSGAP